MYRRMRAILPSEEGLSFKISSDFRLASLVSSMRSSAVCRSGAIPERFASGDSDRFEKLKKSVFWGDEIEEDISSAEEVREMRREWDLRSRSSSERMRASTSVEALWLPELVRPVCQSASVAGCESFAIVRHRVGMIDALDCEPFAIVSLSLRADQ